MEALKKIAGIYMVLVAIAVGVQFVISPFVDNAEANYPIWSVLNWFMTPCVVFALISSFSDQRTFLNSGDLENTVQYIRVKAMLYSSGMLTLMYLWNWLADFYNSDITVMWGFIDPLFVMVCGTIGVRLAVNSNSAS